MPETFIVQAANLTRLHDRTVESWHQLEPPDNKTPVDDEPSDVSLIGLLLAQHRANFDLWHAEDLARDPNAPDTQIASVKHAIDRFNQLRNNLTEAVDALLQTSLQQNPAAVLHSETPGMMLDRMSIIALKVYHTRVETLREDATPAHREKNRNRLALLEEQRNDLAACFDTLLHDIASGRRRFKLYRQMKMYNDPELNPVLYRRPGG